MSTRLLELNPIKESLRPLPPLRRLSRPLLKKMGPLRVRPIHNILIGRHSPNPLLLKSDLSAPPQCAPSEEEGGLKEGRPQSQIHDPSARLLDAGRTLDATISHMGMISHSLVPTFSIISDFVQGIIPYQESSLEPNQPSL